MMIEILDGSYVRLEPLSVDHVENLAQAAGGDRSSFGLTTVPDGLEETRSFVEMALRLAQDGTQLPFAVRSLRTEEIVGSTRFLNIEYWNRESNNANPDSVEIGHTWYSAQAQGTTVNPETKLLLLQHAFEVWNCKRVQLKTDARNERSMRAIAGIGAKFEGVLRNYQQVSGSGIVPGTARDTAMFSIIPAEWPTVKAGLHQRLNPTD